MDDRSVFWFIETFAITFGLSMLSVYLWSDIGIGTYLLAVTFEHGLYLFWIFFFL